MGQKTNPIGFRLSVRRNWESRWYANKKDLPGLVKEDYRIREHLMDKLRYASVPRIFIERASNRVRVKVFTARPGVVIGQKGRQLEQIKADLAKLTGKDVLLDIHEVKKPEIVAYIVAEQIALQLERRISFRRAMKKAVQSALSMGAEGIRVRCGGRLGGAEIARVELVRQGRVPLHTLRANIDYGFAEANTVAGKIGIKVWIGKKEDEQY
jgi:small subunit ribosomal protein S3